MNIPGLGNLQKQVMKMQQDMEKAQEELDAERLETSLGGVSVTTSGMGELVDIKLSPEIVDPNDIEMLQDLVTTAVRDAMKKAQDHHSGRMGPITGGLGGKLPGLGSPLGF